jgi:hypothetical protein
VVCGADAGRLVWALRCAECAPHRFPDVRRPAPPVLWFPREVRTLLTPPWERAGALIWLGLSLGYFGGLLLFGVWWAELQAVRGW